MQSEQNNENKEPIAHSSMKKTFSLRLFFLGVCIFLIFIMTLIINHARFWLEQPIIVHKTLFEVQSGDSLRKVVESAHQQQLIKNTKLNIPADWILRIYGRWTGTGQKIQAGHFEFEGALSPKDFLETLAKGATVTFSVTLVEGKTLSNWIDQLWQAQHVRREIPKELSSRAAYPFISKMLKLPTDSPEGWFYPDTYRYSVGDSEMEILLRAHLRMKSSLDKTWAKRQKDIPLKSAYEALILASIIEKETGAKDERAQIAGVFVRRLNKKMRLQTDPTVIYGQGENFTGNLKRVHLREANDYNTYIIPGLPPTPIAMPSQAALDAAVNPTAGNAIFFVSRGDGTHVFSETLEQHNQAVREFQLKISK